MDDLPMQHEVWTRAAGRPVRSLVCGEPQAGVPEVVILPGLGAPGYLLDLLSACGAWTRARLLDLPGFGSRRTSGCAADLDALEPVAAGCLDGGLGPVLLTGHSTGAQLALRAAVAGPRHVAGLALVGVTFDPAVRQARLRLLPRLRTYLRERPRELVVTLPDYVRAGRRLPQYVLSALADVPEERIGAVRAPVLVLRGEHDTLCPPAWAAELAVRARHGDTVTLPGSHNVPYTHPGAVSLHLARLARGA